MAVTARIMGMLRVSDEEHLELAASNGWTLMTHNGKHFHALHRAWRAARPPRAHAGIVVVPYSEPVDIVIAVLSLVQQGAPLENRVYVLAGGGSWVVDPTAAG